MAELGVQPPTDLYPKPPSQQQGGLSGLSDPTRLIDLMGALTRNQMLQNELKGRAAVGQAYQGALLPDGSFDPNKLSSGLRDNPAASWMLPEMYSNFLNQQGTLSDIRTKQDATVRAIAGTLPPNATDEQIRHYGVTLSRAGIPPAIITGHLDQLLKLKGARRAAAIADLQTSAIGPAGIANQTEAPATAGGMPQRRGLGGVLREQAQTGATPYGQPVGEPERQTASAVGASELEATGRTTARYHSDLENLKQDSKIMENLGGPTVETEKKLNQLSQRIGGFGITMSADQLRALESFDKIAQSISQQQAASFHGSDASLHASVASNPNSGMSRYGREGVIDMLQGNQDAIDKTRSLWFEARRRGAPASSFNDFMERTSQAIDPRVFQFNRMNAENQKKFAQDMDQGDVEEFKRKYRDAVEKGWVKPPKASTPGKQSQAPARNKQSQTEPPMPGARLAADGHWYVKQPHANGDYQRVVMNA